MYILSLFCTFYGTLFCLPLRTEEQAASSVLKKIKIKYKNGAGSEQSPLKISAQRRNKIK